MVSVNTKGTKTKCRKWMERHEKTLYKPEGSKQFRCFFVVVIDRLTKTNKKFFGKRNTLDGKV